jgi:hypothetical protein
MFDDLPVGSFIRSAYRKRLARCSAAVHRQSAITGNYGQGIQAFECLAGGPTSDWAPSLAGKTVREAVAPAV